MAYMWGADPGPEPARLSAPLFTEPPAPRTAALPQMARATTDQQGRPLPPPVPPPPRWLPSAPAFVSPPADGWDLPVPDYRDGASSYRDARTALGWAVTRATDARDRAADAGAAVDNVRRVVDRIELKVDEQNALHVSLGRCLESIAAAVDSLSAAVLQPLELDPIEGEPAQITLDPEDLAERIVERAAQLLVERALTRPPAGPQ